VGHDPNAEKAWKTPFSAVGQLLLTLPAPGTSFELPLLVVTPNSPLVGSWPGAVHAVSDLNERHPHWRYVQRLVEKVDEYTQHPFPFAPA
jgi:hypothetical protein